MAITNIQICINQDRGAYDDAADIDVEMNDDEVEENGRRVFIRQIEESNEGDSTHHEIFIDGKDALNSLIDALTFIRDRKGWTKEERR